MRGVFLLFVCVALALNPAFADGPHAGNKKHRAHKAEPLDQATKDIIEKVENRFEEIRGFSAKFRQTFHNASMGTKEESSGTVVMQKPLKMRWEYATPDEQSIISDGKMMFYYIPAEKQVIVEPLDNVVNSRSPALFLVGGKKLRELFAITPRPKGGDGGRTEAGISLTLEPKEKSISVTRIVINMEAQDYTIRSLSLYDWVGNRSDIEFSGMKVNEQVDDGVFKFTRPSGVELIESPKF